MYTCGSQIEARRRPIAEKSVFSYRFSPSATGELYASSDAWNAFWSHCLQASEQCKTVLVADIADFYNQIYHHTIQNQLTEAGWPNQATKWVLRFETITAKVSRGIPVSPHCLPPARRSIPDPGGQQPRSEGSDVLPLRR